MGERILVPFDGSKPATDALTYAIETFPEATITALYVVELPGGYWTAFEDPKQELPGFERARERADETLAEAIEFGDEHDRDVETEVVTGEPKRRIVQQAEADDVDLIVIGSHGRTGVSRTFLGSVAEAVVRRSPIPTLVVK